MRRPGYNGNKSPKTTPFATRAKYCAIKINGRSVIALPDTGADVSILSSRTAKAIKLSFTLSPSTVKPFGSKPIQLIGKVLTEVRIGDRDLLCAFYIAEQYNESCLLGVNFLFANKISVCYSSEYLLHNGEQLAKLFKPTTLQCEASARDHHSRLYQVSEVKKGQLDTPFFRTKFNVARTIELPPNTATHVPVYGDYNGAAIPVSAETSPKLNHHHMVRCENQLVNSDAQSLVVANWKSSPIKLNINETIAVGVPIYRITNLATTPAMVSHRLCAINSQLS